jgi:hypothetical protein
MRSLGYVPQVILTDVHNHAVTLDTNLAAADLEISRMRKDIERERRHNSEIINTKNATIADLQDACKNYEAMTKNFARLVSVYVARDTTTKAVRLMLAGVDKGGNSVAVPIRNLVYSNKNAETLRGEAGMLSVSFGIPDTSVASLT